MATSFSRVQVIYLFFFHSKMNQSGTWNQFRLMQTTVLRLCLNRYTNTGNEKLIQFTTFILYFRKTLRLHIADNHSNFSNSSNLNVKIKTIRLYLFFSSRVQCCCCETHIVSVYAVYNANWMTGIRSPWMCWFVCECGRTYLIHTNI